MTEPLWQWDELVAAAEGRADGTPSVPITGFSIDTRTLAPGDVFVALKAERDGHDFVGDAFKAGAAAALVCQGLSARHATMAPCFAPPIRSLRCRPSAARRASAPTPASSPSPAAPARPAPRRCCGCACPMPAPRTPRRNPTTITGACR